MSLVLQGVPMAALARDAKQPELLEAWRVLLSAPAVDEALRPWLGTGVEALRLDDVRLATRDDPGLRGPALRVLGRSGADPFSLLIGFAQALDAVERILGGSHAGGARPLSPAECGLLGYGISRLFTVLDAGLILDHVESVGAPFEQAEGQALVSGALQGGFGTLPLRALLSPALAARLLPLTMQAYLGDVPAPGALADLSPGDVLLGDGFLLTATSRGLAGSLRLAGVGAPAPARLDGGEVWVVPGVESATQGELRLILTERSVDLWTWASVRAGRGPAFRHLVPGPVTLDYQGQRLGAGELVTHRGTLGVRITECGSAGSPARPPA